jgi:hypothetical protein
MPLTDEMVQLEISKMLRLLELVKSRGLQEGQVKLLVSAPLHTAIREYLTKYDGSAEVVSDGRAQIGRCRV